MIKEAIAKVVNKEDLTYDEAYAVMTEIVDGTSSAIQNAAFLAALSAKNTRAATTDEITGCAKSIQDHAIPVVTGMPTMEIAGTGGDYAGSFNISTTSAMVIAAGGVKVTKHGNRAASSKCGTADCLEAMGVNIQQEPERCLELLEETGFCFFFTQKYHPFMKTVSAIREELGFRNVFNILVPLTNPAKPETVLLGVSDEYLVQPLTQVLIGLGVKRGMVVFGQDRMDEISASSATTVSEIRDCWYRSYTITPEQFGLTRCSQSELTGGTPDENAKITKSVLMGEQGPRRTAVLMNAGAGLYLGGAAESMEAGIALAAKLIDSGKAYRVLEQVIARSNG